MFNPIDKDGFMQLGTLEKGDLRHVWKHDAKQFTGWLAKKENLRTLSEEIGIQISLVQAEAKVGRFTIDILAEEENTTRKIVIMNQLEATNLDQFGKLITYASGFNAEIVIWIAKDIRDEQKKTIDWLNERTDAKLNLFAIELELWKIGDSPYAPKFQIIAKPSDWAKATKTATTGSSLSDNQFLQLDLWRQFREFAQNTGTKLRLGKPQPQNWYEISIGYSSAHLSLTVNSQLHQISCELFIPNSKDLFFELKSFKDAIQSEMGSELDWAASGTKKVSRIRISRDGDITDTEMWDGYFAWFVEKAERFQTVFSKYIKKALISSYIRILKFDNSDHIRILKSDNSDVH